MIYDELADWLQHHLPEVHDDLNAGATESQLNVLAQHVGVELPAVFCELYRWHNGQKQNSAGLFYGMGFMPLAQVQEAFDGWSSLIEREGPDGLASLGEYSTSARDGVVRRQYANLRWLPFALDWGGNFVGVDLDPGPSGKYAQVINFGRDEDKKFALAESLSEFMTWFVAQLKSGNYSILDEDDGGRSFNTKHPESSHFLSSIRTLFAEA